MNGSTLFMGFLAGTIGTGFFIYGKKQQKYVPMLCGIGLFVMPYLIDDLWLLAAAALTLCLLPFVIKSE